MWSLPSSADEDYHSAVPSAQDALRRYAVDCVDPVPPGPLSDRDVLAEDGRDKTTIYMEHRPVRSNDAGPPKSRDSGTSPSTATTSFSDRRHTLGAPMLHSVGQVMVYAVAPGRGVLEGRPFRTSKKTAAIPAMTAASSTMPAMIPVD